MNAGRLIAGVVLIVGLVVLGKGFVRETKEGMTPPTQYILHFRADVNEAKNGVVVVNENGFAWPDPVFSISNRYHLRFSGNIGPGATAKLPFSDFTNDAGQAFTDLAQFSDFDIRTATMAHAKKR
jgi:hypothetical protein